MACIYEALPRVSGEQGNKSKKLKGTGDQRQFWGTGNIENQDFDFGEQGKMPIFQGNKGTGTPAPPPPPGRASYTVTPELFAIYIVLVLFKK